MAAQRNESRLPPAGRLPFRQKESGLRLLSLDGGGVRGLSELCILEHLMNSLKEEMSLPNSYELKPCDVFDMICGTSTGGLIAIMLGRLQMTVSDCIESYSKLTESVFGSPRSRLNLQDGRYDFAKLEKAVDEIVHEQKQGDAMLDTRPNACKVFVCAVPAATMNRARRLRTYDERSIGICTIRDAARATTAAPTFFKETEITIRAGIRERFLDGGLGYNNPIFELYEEAKSVFQGRRIDCLVSIGSGSSSLSPVPPATLFQSKIPTNIMNACRKITVQCGHNHDRMASQFADCPGVYFRFSVDVGLERIAPDEWKRLGDIQSVTLEYLDGPAIKQQVHSAARALKEPLNEPVNPLPNSDPLPSSWNTVLNSAGQNRDTEGMRIMFDQDDRARIRRPEFATPTVVTPAHYHAFIGKLCTDPSTMYNVRNEKTERHEGTCEWINAKTKYQDWLSQPGPRVLLIVAPPGQGKSTMAKYILRETGKKSATKPGAITLEYFCHDSPGHNSTLAIVQSLTYQLLESRPSLFEALFFQHRRIIEQDSDLGPDSSWEIFLTALQNPQIECVYCVIDGLDECTDRSQTMFWKLIEKDLINKRSEDATYVQKIHILITSRPTGLAKQIGLLTSEIEIQRDDVDPDIEKYVKFRVERMTSAQLIPDDISTLTRRLLHERAEGMFLWVSLILDQLENYEDSLSFHDVLDSFESVPSDIQGLYDRALEKITAKESLYAKATKIFSILLCSAQPLTTSAFALAMTEWPESCTTHQELMRRSDFRFEYTCKNACGTLIRIVDNTVQLCHPTAREFLLKESLDKGLFGIDQPAGHALLAEICLRYLMLKDVEIPQGDEEPDAQRYPLLAYALTYWPLHVRYSSDRIQSYKETIRRFFGHSSIARFHSCLRSSDYWTSCFPKDSLSEDLIVHVTVYFDLKNLLQSLSLGGNGAETTGSEALGDETILELNSTVDARNSYGDTALLIAIAQGLTDMVLSLLKLGADPNATNYAGVKALHRAAQEQDLDVVKVLLQLTDDLEAQTSDGDTPLLFANDFGVVKALLDAGANVNARRREGGYTPLHFAAQKSTQQVVEILLEKGADINAMSDSGRTPLWGAARAGTAPNVRLLLDAKAEILSELQSGWNPLHAASYNGSVECMNNLLDHGVWPDEKTMDGNTALHLAADRGHLGAAEVLLEAGCSLDAQNEDGDTALILAAQAGHASIVNLLLAARASVNIVSSTDDTALSIAVTHGHTEVVRLLLDHGAEKNFVPEEKPPMLHLAVYRGHRDVVDILLESGINHDLKWRSCTPLYLAASKDDMATVNQLLEKGAEIHCPGPDGTTILHRAIRHERQELANRLLNLGHDVNAFSHVSWTVLHVAVDVGQLDIATRLVRAGALVNTPSVSGTTPLHVCCWTGNLDLLDLLLKAGANILSRRKDGLIPLDVAALNGNLQIVDRIIQELREQQVPVDTWSSALLCAAAQGHLDVLRRLLQEGLDIDIKDCYGWTPLMCAIANNQQRVTEFLINNGADNHTTNNRGFTILHEAARHGMTSLVRRLLAEGLDPLSMTLAGGTPLSLAAKAGHVNIVRSLLSHKSNIIQDRGLDGELLHAACQSGNLVILDLLLRAGCDVHALDWMGRSAIHAAAEYGHNDLLCWLIEKHVDGARPDKMGDSPLHRAAEKGYEDVVASLIHQGVPIDPVSEYGITPLLSATIGRRFKCIDLLINAGGDPTVKDIFGRSALDTAASTPSLLARMGSWGRSIEPTDPILLVATQRRAVRSRFQHLCSLNLDDHLLALDGMDNLNIGLILLKEYELCRMGMLILTRPLADQLLVWTYDCHTCQKTMISSSTVMRICQTCTTYLCDSCFGRYNNERQPDDCLCEGHEFLTVSQNDWDEMEPRYEYTQEKIRLVREAWLTKMRERFLPLSPAELDSS